MELDIERASAARERIAEALGLDVPKRIRYDDPPGVAFAWLSEAVAEIAERITPKRSEVEGQAEPVRANLEARRQVMEFDRLIEPGDVLPVMTPEAKEVIEAAETWDALHGEREARAWAAAGLLHDAMNAYRKSLEPKDRHRVSGCSVLDDRGLHVADCASPEQARICCEALNSYTRA